MLALKALGQVRQGEHVLAGAPARAEAEADGALVHRLFQLLHALQRLFAALGGADGLLAVEHAVARDDRLLALDLLLLQLVGLHARLEPLLALAHVARVVAVILLDRAHEQLRHAGADVVHEVAVVRDDEDGAAIALQIALQPLGRLQVQVVGRLVEQQQVRTLQEQARQAQARALAAAERIGRLVVLRAGEAQARQHAGDGALPAVAVRLLKGGGQPVVLAREPVKRGRVVVRVGHLVLERAQALLHAKDRLKDLLQLAPYGVAGGGHALLGEVAHAQAAREAQLAAVGRVEPGDDLHERRLAAAVDAHQAHAVALLEGEVYIFEHDVDAK